MLGRFFHRPQGRILAVRLGLNPNSSSLGADVTFLLFGLAFITCVTPVVGLLVRLQKLSEKPETKP